MKAVPYMLPLCFILVVSCRNKQARMFKEISSKHSGIYFNNKIVENDSINPLDLTNMYNGGGVGIGDFNNDGLQDIYFTGNLVENKLYLNRGNFKFDDVTKEAGVTGDGKWCRGVAVLDINNDGWMDMYVCASMLKDARKRENLLYINQGLNKDGIPQFKEMAAEYGLNDSTHSTMAAFFDYDNDGDLDMYLVVNEIRKYDNPSIFRPVITDGSHFSTGRLYRNDWSDSLKHPVFVNVTKQAGVTIEGYGHAVSIADFNKDGWKDIFVTNDFISNDLLYINNHDGSFTNKAAAYFKHTSANGMGQDVIDINNDGLADVVELDMSPEDNYRKKMMLMPTNYNTYQNTEHYGYQYQYVRNTLQLNQGPRVNENDSIGDPVFSDIGFLAGISETDWSWTPLVQDFDNDGFRDILVTNGYPRDVTDHDFIAFQQRSSAVSSKEYTLSQIPQVKINNYAFHNNGNLTFSNSTADWGLNVPSFSNGAAYADLDNDGDLDLVVNNINDDAFIYENTLRSNGKKNDQSHYLSVKLIGDSLNRNGIGTWVELYANHTRQVYELSPYRGYLSTVQLNPHFGLGAVSVVDSLIVKWPNGKKQVLQNVPADKTIEVNSKNAGQTYNWSTPIIADNSLFREITDSAGIHSLDKDKDFIDFNIQKLLPHKFSEYRPALAAGDIDGNGLDDIICGGSSLNNASIFLQQKNNRFIEKKLSPEMKNTLHKTGDAGILLFDADGDGDLDMYIASGGYQEERNTASYRDRFYINDGKGNFTLDTTAFPVNLASKSCVRAVDYDNDGDLDIFIAGRVDPRNYPKPVSSFIYRNDSENGHIKFTDVTGTVAKDLLNIGLVCDAVFTDFDNDGWSDLILAGEWMPITFLKNDKGVFKNVTAASGISNYLGWWTTITPGDFDNDGDIDYVVGNLGENSFYKTSDRYPVSVYAKDFDKNGILECIPTKYLKDKDGILKEFTAHTRDDVVEQMPFIKKKFLTYKSFAEASFDKLFTPEELKGALKLQANYFKSAFIRNKGNGTFEISALPEMAQFSSLNGMVTDDFDGDGNLDVVINTNDYGTEVSTGRYDALNGLVLKGKGDGTFMPLSILQSGIYIPGNGKALVKLRGANGKYLIAAGENRGPLKVFELKKNIKTVPLQNNEISAELKYKNGHSQKQEFNFGSSFLSQSARFLKIDTTVQSVTIYDSKGGTREINF
jgi:hypothetical protein